MNKNCQILTNHFVTYCCISLQTKENAMCLIFVINQRSCPFNFSCMKFTCLFSFRRKNYKLQETKLNTLPQWNCKLVNCPNLTRFHFRPWIYASNHRCYYWCYCYFCCCLHLCDQWRIQDFRKGAGDSQVSSVQGIHVFNLIIYNAPAPLNPPMTITLLFSCFYLYSYFIVVIV